MSKALLVFADHGVMNTSNYRVMIPAKYLTKAGHQIEVMSLDDLLSQNATDETILIERVVFPDIVNTLRSMGCQRLVLTFDDGYRLIPTATRSFEFWKGKERGIEMWDAARGMVDATIVPSRALAKDYNAQLIPNYHDPDLWNFELAPRSDDHIIVGWGGSEGHRTTWERGPFAGALAAVQRKHSNVAVHVYGGVPDNALYNAGCHFTTHDWVPFSKWPQEIAKWDIGLAPLEGEYDLRRSALKLIEYGLAGIPFVATDAGEYQGAPGGRLVFNTQKSWTRALMELVGNQQLRTSFGEIGHLWAQDYLMPARVKDYEAVLWPE